jgi:hypothetical protein
MSLSKMIRELFVPGSRAFGDMRRRQRRILILSLMFAMIIAVAFGLALYRLNASGRFQH